MEPLVALGLGIDESNGWYSSSGGGSSSDGGSNSGNSEDGGRGLARPATRILGLMIQTAERLLPRDVSSKVLSDLQSLVGAASNRNNRGRSEMMHAGIEETCEPGLSTDRHISAEGLDYPTRAR